MKEIINKQLQGKGYVELDRKEIGDQGLAYLCQQDTHKVRALSMWRNSLTPMGMAHFPKANWERLVRIDLWSGNQIGNKGCKYLSQANLNNLQKLQLGYNKIGSEGAAHLSKAPFKSLRQLSIYHNKMANGAFWWLIRGNWSTVKEIVTQSNRITLQQRLNLVLSQFKSIQSLPLSNYSNDKRGETYQFKVLNEKLGQGKIRFF